MRNATIDYARLVAACGIVIFHAGAPGAEIGYAGLPFFLILLGMFGLRENRSASFGEQIRIRAQRLLMPWLGWSVIYASAKAVEVQLTHKPWTSEFAAWMLATGPALHLWFLPFAFLSGLMLYFAAPVFLKSGPLFCGLFCALAFLLPVFLPFNSFGPPLAQYLFALPSFCLGVAFALPVLVTDHPKPAPIKNILMMCVLTAGLWLADFPGGGMQMVIGGWVVVLCQSVPMAATAVSRFAANIALTVYLLHPLVMGISGRLFDLPEKGPALGITGLALTVAICTILHGLFLRIAPNSVLRNWFGF